MEIDGPSEWEFDPVIALPGELGRLISHSRAVSAEAFNQPVGRLPKTIDLLDSALG